MICVRLRPSLVRRGSPASDGLARAGTRARVEARTLHLRPIADSEAAALRCRRSRTWEDPGAVFGYPAETDAFERTPTDTPPDKAGRSRTAWPSRACRGVAPCCDTRR